VRHGAGTFLSRREKLLRLQHFGALQMAELGGPAFNACARQGEDANELGVQIALHDLGRQRRGAKAQLFADKRFHLGERCALVPTARKFSHRDPCAHGPQPFQRAGEFIVHERHFNPKVIGSRGCRGCDRSSA